MVTYMAKDGDLLDWIVWKHYGTTSVLEQVLQANPNLTNEILSAGTIVRLPYIEEIKKTNTEIRLWS